MRSRHYRRIIFAEKKKKKKKLGANLLIRLTVLLRSFLFAVSERKHIIRDDLAGLQLYSEK